MEEKNGVQGVIPAPASAAIGNDDHHSRATRLRRRRIAHFLTFGTLCAIFTVWPGLGGPSVNHHVSQGDAAQSSGVGCEHAVKVQGYMDRLTGSPASEQAYTEFKKDKHHHHKEKHDKHKHKHDKHKHDKHGHHDDKGKHGHHGPPPHRWISPKEAEDIFLTVPDNDTIRADLHKYTETAHPAGSGFDYITALQVKSQWERSLGLPSSGADEQVFEAGSRESQESILGGMTEASVWIDTYYPVLNTPVHASVTLLTDPPVHAKLKEDIIAEGDPDSVLRDEVPVFHGLSVSGDVTGQVVYVGYGRKRDFEALHAKGSYFTFLSFLPGQPHRLTE